MFECQSFDIAYAVPAARPRPTPRPAPVASQYPRPRVLFSHISRVRRDRDFGRVEAWVLVAFQYDPALPPRVEKLFTSVAVGPSRRPGALRCQLIEKTMKLAVLMHRTDRGGAVRQI